MVVTQGASRRVDSTAHQTARDTVSARRGMSVARGMQAPLQNTLHPLSHSHTIIITDARRRIHHAAGDKRVSDLVIERSSALANDPGVVDESRDRACTKAPDVQQNHRWANLIARQPLQKQ